MTAGAVLGAALATLWALDGFRLRGRAAALAKLDPSDEPVSADHRFVMRSGAVVDDATQRAASSFARENGLRALDLVSPSLPSWRALLFLQSIDVAKFRANRLAAGRSAGDAILVDAKLWDILSEAERAPRTLIDITRVARKAKLHACTETDFAIAPGLTSAPAERGARTALVEYVFGEFSFGLLLMQLGLLALAIALSRPAGLAALAAMNLQLAVGVVGTSLLPRDLAVHTLFRAPLDLAMALVAWPAGLFRANPRAEERRAIYDELLAGGTSRFFEPRRESCPICDARDLSPRLVTVDRYGFKPGVFTLERCGACGHVFQNPRLSIEGLDFYYRDFYDGLGEGLLDTLFSFDSHSYEMRAKIVDGVATPERWLDVGAGHGHFCCIAREHWKNTEFDGLDLSESIDEAKRRGWIDRAYRGLFPELAGDIAREARRYDVVSMSHYLEHTRDPRAEIEAARTVLAPSGLLMIEVPDPESKMGRAMGSFWVPWFQPQHQHLLSVRNLSEILRANAFEPVVVHRGAAHQRNDLTFFVFTLLNRVARPADLPWRRSAGPLRRLWRQIVWCPGLLVVGFFWAIDQILAPLLAREGWSNTYRVLARRTS